MISFEQRGSFDRTTAYLTRLRNGEHYRVLSRYAEKGRAALALATPQDTGLASQSWATQVLHRGSGWEIQWLNSDKENGFPVVISLQYGYSTGTGGYVRGRDFINPVLKPLFDEIADAVWREVTRA